MLSVIFRVDASRTIGTGHVMRCLTLASRLREHDASVSFVCREHDGHLCDLIEERGIPVSRLSGVEAVAPEADAPAHADSLGCSWRKDVEQTCAAIAATGVKPDWLVVDHYAIDLRWEGAVRGVVGRILAIDDLADRGHDCDLLLDQNLAARRTGRYHGKVPAACGMLLGPRYALLQPVYAELHDRVPPRRGAIRRIFIFFGGADNDNLMGRTLAAFLSLQRPEIEVDAVMPAGSPHANAIRGQVAGHGNIHLHGEMASLAKLIAQADLGIGAGGMTTWERLCLGLPALVVTLAENQHSNAEELTRCGQIRWLGHGHAVDQAAIAGALGKLLEQGLDEGWSLRCHATVDGKGVDRVRTAMTATAALPITMRLARLEDEALLLEWVNDPATRQNAFSPKSITATTHKKWFRSRLSSPDNYRLYIAEATDGVALGQVRFERQGEAWEVHYALAPAFRGRGLGRFLLEAALLKLGTDMRGTSVFGQVKDGNQPSRRIFEALDFNALPDAERGVVVYQRTL